MALDLAKSLRRADADELLANGRCPSAGLLRCCDLSALLFAIQAPGGRTISLFGFAETAPEAACPWLLASDELTTTHRSWFIRHSHAIAASGDHRWRHFANRVDARNAVHVRWLRWVGFDVRPAEPHGPLGLPFHPFYRTAPRHSA